MKINHFLKQRLRYRSYRRLVTTILFILTMGITVWLPAAALGESCIDLEDTPLDTMEQAAPGIVMFCIDDSGSMDFSAMLKGEPSGYLNIGDNRYAHVFADAGEDYGSYGNLEGSWHANYYRMQMANYWVGDENKGNRLYYDPTATYTPWPGYENADPVTPKADPTRNYTLNLNETYDDLGQGGGGLSNQDILANGGVIVDNGASGEIATELIIDNTGAVGAAVGSFNTDGSGYYAWNDASADSDYGDNYLYSYYSGRWDYGNWEYQDLEAGNYDVFVWYVDSGNRGTSINYKVYNAGGTQVASRDFNQRENGGQWNLLASDVYLDGSAKVQLRHYCTSTSYNRACADAVKLVPKFESSVVVDFEDSGGWNNVSSANANDGDYQYSYDGYKNYWARWTADNLDTAETYNVYARWYGGSSTRMTNVHYRTYDNTTEIADTPVNQREHWGEWMLIAEGVSFSSGVGKVEINETTGTYGLGADAVAFMPAVDTGSINLIRAHYYVQGTDGGIYLVNLDGDHEYYRVNDDNNNGEVDSRDELESLTDAEASQAGITTGLSFADERQNFANWYSYYRKRHLTAKNAIANVISDMQGVYIGLHYINSGLGSIALPIRVEINEVLYDRSDELLDILYGKIPNGGTPLRGGGLDRVGKYFQGAYGKPSSADFPVGTFSDASYPFYSDSSGTCQQAFCILMTDGFWNGAYPTDSTYYYDYAPTSNVGNADGDNSSDFDGAPYADNASNTLADIAMHYYENDLQGDIDDNVPVNSKDTNNAQHMVTYSLSFGLDGTITQSDYDTCPLGACPTWPTPTSDGQTTIDDLWHASVNGRGLYVNAASPQEMVQAMQTLGQDIMDRLGSSAALATNSIQQQVGTVIYQGTYNTAGWFGDVKALKVNSDGSVDTEDPLWRASQNIPEWDKRNIISFDGSASIDFPYDSLTGLSDSQKTLLANNSHDVVDLVNFLRGDDSKDMAHNGTFRVRSAPIGDIVHSAPFYYKGEVYIGANDGMLHAVSSATGEEVFCYVPNMVYDHLSELAVPGYSHRYYVDGTATAAVVKEKDILVCGLGKGGKGYFGLNITSPANPVALWEYTGDNDLGYSFSKAVIINTAAGRLVMFGNGYDSVSGTAALFFIDPEGGSLVAKIDTGVKGCNGLATPSAVDVDGDKTSDYVFAGDLHGNMWKFDIRGTDTDLWKVYYGDQPLVKVQSASGSVQPITAAPEVMLDCARSDFSKQGAGMMVLFGTGRYLNSDDFGNSDVQSFYGVWDWGDIWEKKDSYDVAKTKYLGTVEGADRTLSNVNDASLQEQSVSDAGSGWKSMSDSPVNWYDPEENTGEHMGWVFDLPADGERGVRAPDLIGEGALELISIIPSSSPCESGGSSILYRVSACSGGYMDDPQFDTNSDGSVDENDETFGAKEMENMIFEGISIGDQRYYSDTQGGVDNVQKPPISLGMQYFRVIQ